MARRLLLILATWVSIILLILGGIFAFLNLVWSVEWEYRVDVTAASGVTWTLWIPHPGLSMPWTTSGSVVVVGTIETDYGTRINITGTGSGRVRFSNSTTLIDLEPWGGIPPGLRLSGGEGEESTEFYRLWRHSSDPSANLAVSGGLGFVARASAEIAACDGSGFVGSPEEGWHALPFRSGECGNRFTRPPNVIPLLLIGPGSVLAGALVAARRHPPKA